MFFIWFYKTMMTERGVSPLNNKHFFLLTAVPLNFKLLKKWMNFRDLVKYNYIENLIKICQLGWVVQKTTKNYFFELLGDEMNISINIFFSIRVRQIYKETSDDNCLASYRFLSLKSSLSLGEYHRRRIFERTMDWIVTLLRGSKPRAEDWSHQTSQVWCCYVKLTTLKNRYSVLFRIGACYTFP